ncbi:MAG: aminoacyl-tRNA hydrolase [candidate division NC10 bacterium]|nr:aminoacyl-tRNA hydrolase [candidate division NC10 bacterium]
MTPPAMRHPIPPGELAFEFFRASGPGGQNVNKVSTAVRLRFDVGRSPSLPATVKERLRRLAGNRLTHEGILTIEARRFRTQEQNREDAVDRLLALIEKAWEPPRHRRPTKPTEASRQRRLEAKKHRGAAKRKRGAVGEGE